MCVSHPAKPNAVGSLQAHLRAKLDSLILVQTPVSLCSPGYHCQPVLKLHTLLALCPPMSLVLPTSWWALFPQSRLLQGKKQLWWLVRGLGLWGRHPVFSGPPLGSINDPCAKRRKLCNVGTPLQSVRNPHTQNIYVLVSGNDSWPASSRGAIPLCGPVWVGCFPLGQDLAEASLVQQ